MSQQNVEAVRSFYASGPSNVLEAEPEVNQAFGDFLDEDFEIRLTATWPEGEQAFRGRDGFARFFAMLRESFDEWCIEPVRFLDAGDRVVVFVHMRARGVESGAEVEFDRSQVWTFCDRRAVSMRVYIDHAEALHAVGLQE
jgi:ketosteroid isomerase-like protein